MADLTTAQKAPLLVDGEELVAGTASIFSSDHSVATPQNINTEDGLLVYVVAVGEGTADITVEKDGRSGGVSVTVTEAPLDVSLGTPEPK